MENKVEASTISVDAITSGTFVSEWDTTKTSTGSSSYNQIKLPLQAIGTYDFVVNWGDGLSNTIVDANYTLAIHTYVSAGVYNLTIDGTIIGWQFANSGDKNKIIEISQWGNLQIGNSGSYFDGCQNLDIIAVDSLDLTGTTSLYRAFATNLKFVGTDSINNWDVSGITDMSYMFYIATSFNQPLNSWDVSSVTDMSYMFHTANLFNQSLSSWNVSGVNDMSYMFKFASSFNLSIDSWNVSSVNSMVSMFFGASSFNQPLNQWNVSAVTDMSAMFSSATTFNQPLNNWDVSSVTDMSSMFYDAVSFNQPLNSWDVSSVTDMSSMFYDAVSFNQPLNNWDVSNVTNMFRMFHSARSFNQLLDSWDVSNVTNMVSMFSDASSFNQPLNNWDMSSVTYSSYMFDLAISFNQPLNKWNLSSATNIYGMFHGAASFNQPLDNWDVSNQYNLDYMFFGASSFDQDIGNWNVSKAVGLKSMLVGSSLSTTNYDKTLEAWSKLSLKDGVVFHVGNIKYTNKTAKQYIEDTYNWWIIDGGLLQDNGPNIDAPEDVIYEYQSIGNSVVWTVGDQDPDTYNVTLDDNSFIYDTKWTNGSITINIDGLSLGDHILTIYISDTLGNVISDTVNVQVVDTSSPIISSPSDVSYEFGDDGNELKWTVGDQNPNIYNITLDSELYVSDMLWRNGSITLNIDDLAVGDYTFKIQIYDESGNVALDTVTVTVTEKEISSSNNSDTPTLRLFTAIISILSIYVAKSHSRKNIE